MRSFNQNHTFALLISFNTNWLGTTQGRDTVSPTPLLVPLKL